MTNREPPKGNDDHSTHLRDVVHWGKYPAWAGYGAEDHPFGLYPRVFNPPEVTCPVCLDSDYGYGKTVLQIKEMPQAEWEEFAIQRG